MERLPMKLTLNQHLELGKSIKEFRDKLMQKHVLEIGTKDSKENKAVRKTLRQIDDLRSQLDFVVCHEHAYFDKAHRVYYGPERVKANDQAQRRRE